MGNLMFVHHGAYYLKYLLPMDNFGLFANVTFSILGFTECIGTFIKECTYFLVAVFLIAGVRARQKWEIALLPLTWLCIFSSIQFP